jgi:hypothetical protein
MSVCFGSAFLLRLFSQVPTSSMRVCVLDMRRSKHRVLSSDMSSQPRCLGLRCHPFRSTAGVNRSQIGLRKVRPACGCLDCHARVRSSLPCVNAGQNSGQVGDVTVDHDVVLRRWQRPRPISGRSLASASDIDGAAGMELYRAMAWLGEGLADQSGRAARC